MKFWYDTEFIDNGITIDLISIGMVAENGKAFYAVSKDFNIGKCNPWVEDNVLPFLSADKKPIPWLTNVMIRHHLESFVLSNQGTDNGRAEFWGYYSSYDHVVMAQLFGPMINLPSFFPMYTRDIKQLCDDLGNPKLPDQESTEHNALEDARWNKKSWEFLMNVKEGT